MRYVILLMLMLMCAGEAYADTVCFSPDGGCIDQVLGRIKRAKTTIRIQAYVLSSTRIRDALIAAQTRGVDVKMIMDGDQACAKWSQGDEVLAAGIEVVLDKKHAINHNKTMVIDSQYTITGSYNFTVAAETRNAENLLVLTTKKLAVLYEANWQLHREHSVPYVCKTSSP